MLDKGKDLDWFSSTTIVTLAAIAVVAFVFFVIWELTDKHPVVDLTLFKELNFTSGTITLSVAYGVFFGTNVLLPLWMQNTLGYTATDAGIASRSEEYTSELQSLMRISYAVFCLKKKKQKNKNTSISNLTLHQTKQ